ncbi:hypothetical protein DWU98_09815 [Dyella monticola]|uniref:Uncharacterized protein n=1 Tax=Dyella monticola TaxID=1927958 RepID=A0A370X1M9_9GAMM|nr:hypothetical protein [Dyella monticola]RDS82309.1 hypothetical protein DWU98_09815 [Dyella monticola]
MVDVLVAQTERAGSPLAAMSFRAIFAGWLVATGIAVLLYVGGLAMGFSAFDAWNAPASARGIGIGTAIWMVLTWIVSLWLGGMFASWFAAHDDRTIGSLHGVTVWGLSVTVVFLWLALGLGAMHRGGRPMGPGMGPPQGMPMPAGLAAGAAGAPGGASLAVLQADVQARLTTRDRQTADSIVAALLSGNNAAAATLFAASNRTSTADGAGIVASIAADAQAAQLDMKRRADRMAHNVATALWIGFASVLLGLIAATLGGWVGAHHIGRIYHLRTFETSANHSVRR